MNGIDAEVIIAGGGLAGGTLACLLNRGGVKCVVVDSGKVETSQDNFMADPRALAITPASAQILSSINVWQKLPAERKGMFSMMHVWDENSDGEIHFDSADICVAVLGYIIEQPLLQRHLIDTLRFLPDLLLMEQTAIESFTTNNGTITVRLDNGDSINGRLLVAADGVNSAMRKFAGIEYRRHDYQQQALACVVSTARPHENTARQRFLRRGPLAFLPMADNNTCGVVWSTDPGHAQELLALTAPDFHRQLQSAFDNRLGDIIASGPRKTFPLFRAQAGHYSAERLALIGDAAHCIHPLAGQGANMGFLDAAVLAEEVLGAAKRLRDPGSRAVLRRYERWRKGENLQMLLLLDVFKHLFENQNGVVKSIRSEGMKAVDKIACIKNRIMRLAMGLEGDLPASAR